MKTMGRPVLGGFFIGEIMTDNRAYSLLHMKSIDEGAREFVGIASTPEPDRVNDVMVPKGAKFKLPMPFLWQHDSLKPIGEIYEAKVTDKGIEVKGRIKKVSAPSQLAARLDEAWVSIREGLVRGLSIGFRPIKYAFTDDGGMIFDEWDWYELSAVTIPMNASGSISAVKSYDAEILKAALGNKEDKAGKPSSSVLEKKSTVKLTPKEGKTMNISEQIKSFQAERSAKAAKMEELMKKSGETGETLAEDDAEAFDTLEAEVATIDKQLDRLGKLEKAKMNTANPVYEKSGQDSTAAMQQRNPVAFSQVRVKQQLEKGIGFARLAKCKALAKMNMMPAYEVADQLYGSDNQISGILKAAVAAGTTTQTTWAAPLVGDESTVFADFVEYLRPMTILGRMGQGGVPGPRRVPFRTRLITQTTGGNAYWTGEGAPKPLTKFDFTGTTLEPLKVATIAVATMELLRDSSPSAEAILRDSLAAAVAERLDIDFIDPAKTASAGVSPASITNGVTPVTSVGNDADAIRCDIQALYASFIAANNAPTNGVFIMSSVTALALSMMLNPLGQREFPGISMMGGTFEGLPVVVSEYVPTDTAGGYVFLVNASDIYLADEGGVTVDMSDQASLQMLDNPTNNPTGSTTATTMVSLWQTNCVGFRAERTINWGKRRASAVAVLDGVNWGSCT